ncbi:MAG: transglutaminase family protein [Acidimicrobiia bacterium]
MCAAALGLPDGIPVLAIGPEQVDRAAVVPLRYGAGGVWESAHWPQVITLESGDGPAGNRLPLDQLTPDGWQWPPPHPTDESLTLAPPGAAPTLGMRDFVRTALVCEARHGAVRVFVPPLPPDGWAALIPLVEQAAAKAGTPVVLEGYGPPHDIRLGRCSVAPDPGVVECNVPPAGDWDELVAITRAAHASAAAAGLTPVRVADDGRLAGTGGGCHITLGGPTLADSPLLRRPDLLTSLLTYWQHHPSLSYAFSGLFVGPTSQAPRIDEARHDSLYELEIACGLLDEHRRAAAGKAVPPEVVDRLFRHLLVDVGGNTHRSEFCVDKLCSPDHPAGRLGLLELRAFESQPDVRMQLLPMLLVRALVARCWDDPYRAPFVRWGTALHDRFMLPAWLGDDLAAVCADLDAHGFAFAPSWFDAHLEHRCPLLGVVEHPGVRLELRAALEPWPVLGEEPGAASPSRPVDSSTERIEVRLVGPAADRFDAGCNGWRVPLAPTATAGTSAAGVRFCARRLSLVLHPTMPAHVPLRFALLDRGSDRPVAGCTYHGTPGREVEMGIEGNGSVNAGAGPASGEFPTTLDLRRVH